MIGSSKEFFYKKKDFNAWKKENKRIRRGLKKIKCEFVVVKLLLQMTRYYFSAVGVRYTQPSEGFFL